MQTEDNKMKFVESVCDWQKYIYFWLFLNFVDRENIDAMNIVFQIFSFVFGDGDPNQGIEEERWKLVIIKH